MYNLFKLIQNDCIQKNCSKTPFQHDMFSACVVGVARSVNIWRHLRHNELHKTQVACILSNTVQLITAC